MASPIPDDMTPRLLAKMSDRYPTSDLLAPLTPKRERADDQSPVSTSRFDAQRVRKKKVIVEVEEVMLFRPLQDSAGPEGMQCSLAFRCGRMARAQHEKRVMKEKPEAATEDHKYPGDCRPT